MTQFQWKKSKSPAGRRSADKHFPVREYSGHSPSHGTVGKYQRGRSLSVDIDAILAEPSPRGSFEQATATADAIGFSADSQPTVTEDSNRSAITRRPTDTLTEINDVPRGGEKFRSFWSKATELIGKLARRGGRSPGK